MLICYMICRVICHMNKIIPSTVPSTNRTPLVHWVWRDSVAMEETFCRVCSFSIVVTIFHIEVGIDNHTRQWMLWMNPSDALPEERKWGLNIIITQRSVFSRLGYEYYGIFICEDEDWLRASHMVTIPAHFLLGQILNPNNAKYQEVILGFYTLSMKKNQNYF